MVFLKNIDLTPGLDGKSAYDLAVEEGFGTVNEWLRKEEGVC